MPSLHLGEADLGIDQAAIPPGEGVAPRTSEDEGGIAQGGTRPIHQDGEVASRIGRHPTGP